MVDIDNYSTKFDIVLNGNLLVQNAEHDEHGSIDLNYPISNREKYLSIINNHRNVVSFSLPNDAYNLHIVFVVFLNVLYVHVRDFQASLTKSPKEKYRLKEKEISIEEILHWL